MANPRRSPKQIQPRISKEKLGLRAWMERVLVECGRASDGFDAEAVHDLRVALRRCLSLADGLIALDPDPSWKAMKKAGKRLFQALGELRDMQVMREWIEKLSLADPRSSDIAKNVSNNVASKVAKNAVGRAADQSANDPAAVKLLEYVDAREAECKQHAFKDLSQFDSKQWRQWSRTLPRRAARARPGSAVYRHLALEKWTAAYALHQHALRTRSKAALHQLRIGVKRFRYTVENFLPQQHADWGHDLKEVQDLLGDVHDLDVLWSTAIAPHVRAFADLETRRRWQEKLTAERAPRLARYRELTVGRESLWRVWRAELPSGAQLRAAVMSRLCTWAGYLDPDFSHSQRVAQWALLLYDGLQQERLLRPQTDAKLEGANSGPDPRDVLRAAALLHDVGKAKRSENHQKTSYRMIRELERPLGWSARELELTAVIARYHRGALPRPRSGAIETLELSDRHLAMECSGILRLANALDRSTLEHPKNDHSNLRGGGSENAPRLEVSAADHSVVVRVEGYSTLDRSAEKVAAARHLLETVLRRPVFVRPLRTLVTRGKSIGGQPVRIRPAHIQSVRIQPTHANSMRGKPAL